MTLDSLGVTWLMIEVTPGLRLWVRRSPASACCRLERDIAVCSRERRFRLELVRYRSTLDDDFRGCRHVEIDCHGPGDLDRSPSQCAGDAELVQVDGKLLRSVNITTGPRTDHDRDGIGSPRSRYLSRVQISARAGCSRDHAHHQSIARFQGAR